MKKILTVLLLMCCALPTFAAKRQSEELITPMSQLEKRQIQTRTYNAQDRLVVMKSILNVLQDDGYIVYNVNSLLGFIYGVKDFELSDNNVDISEEFGLSKSRLNYNGVKVATLEATANVTDYGKDIRVRINFKRKLLNEYGNAQFIDDVSEAEFYADFYEKLNKAIELQKGIAQKVNKKPPVVITEPAEPETKTAEPQETKDSQSEVQINNTPALRNPQIDEKNAIPETAQEETVQQTNTKTEDKQEVKNTPKEKENIKPVPEQTQNIEPPKAKANVKAEKEVTQPSKEQPQMTPAQIQQNFENKKGKKTSVQSEEESNSDIDSLLKQIKEQEKQAKLEVEQAKKEQMIKKKEDAKAAKQAQKEQKINQKEQTKQDKTVAKEAAKAQKAEEIKAQKEAKKQAKHSKEADE